MNDKGKMTWEYPDDEYTDLIDVKKVTLQPMPARPSFMDKDAWISLIFGLFLVGLGFFGGYVCLLYVGISSLGDEPQIILITVGSFLFGLLFLWAAYSEYSKNFKSYAAIERQIKKHNDDLKAEAQRLNDQSRNVYELSIDTLRDISFIQNYSASE